MLPLVASRSVDGASVTRVIFRQNGRTQAVFLLDGNGYIWYILTNSKNRMWLGALRCWWQPQCVTPAGYAPMPGYCSTQSPRYGMPASARAVLAGGTVWFPPGQFRYVPQMRQSSVIPWC